MTNPIIQRELIGLLRTRKAMWLQVLTAVTLTLLVIARWPTDAIVTGVGEQKGLQSLQVLRVFGYGLMTLLILLVPVFPATSIVKEKVQGTLALLLNSPMDPRSIYLGKLVGVLGFVVLMMFVSLPAAAACYAMGGVSLINGLGLLYLVLFVVALQYTALGLLISSFANTTDSALRITYGVVLLFAAVTMLPYQFVQGMDLGIFSTVALWLRCLSPLPAVMELLGHGGVGSAGLTSQGSDALLHPNAVRYLTLAAITIGTVSLWTVSRLNHTLFDKARDQGQITDDRARSVRWFRRFLFLVDPQRRTGMIGPLTNPVMVKEFRCRRFGRLSWLIRLVAVCALVSLGLTLASTSGTMSWGVSTIGGIMVVLQVVLVVLLTPSLAAGLISSERESGGWALMQMTPLSATTIVRGKVMSVVWTLLMVLLATIPGYVVIVFIEPARAEQVVRVMVCLLLTAALAMAFSAAMSSLFKRTAVATAVSYTVLVTLCAGTMLFWLGRGAPFGHSTVERALTLNPMAAALTIIEAPGFESYRLLPMNWYLVAGATAASLFVLTLQTWRLTRPQ
ncbi:MAG: ABC transporter permease subunit [Phycisphaera sp.]|nr:ABC transporter permease subunit [Phycisphaera sp.]